MAISDTPPLAQFKRGGKIVVTANVTSKEVTDPQTGKIRTVYEYDEAEVVGQVTYAKVLAAIRVAERESDVRDATAAMLTYTAAKTSLKGKKVKTLSVPQLGEAVAQILDILGIEYSE